MYTQLQLVDWYLDNVAAFVLKTHTQIDESEPNERLMRAIEEKIGIPEQCACDYRRGLMAKIGSFHTRHQSWNWLQDEMFKNAIEEIVATGVNLSV